MRPLAVYVYILHSAALDKYYCGITRESVERRLEKHNNSTYGFHYTSKANDWEIRLVIPCDNNAEARRTELYIKRMKSRKFIEKLIQHSCEVDRLLKVIRANDSPDTSGH